MNSITDLLLTARGFILARDKMQKTQYYNRDEINRLQIEELKKTLVACYSTIDYYRELFWQRDFDPFNFCDISELSKLPILTKKEILASPQSFFSSAEISRAVKLHTSGTTGNPMTAYTSHKQWVVEQAAIWRHWWWAGYKFRDRMAIFRSYSPKSDEPIYYLDRARNWLYISPYHLDQKSVEDTLSLLQKWSPKFLRGYPSSLFLVAKVAISSSIELPSIKGILTASEVLSDEHRVTIESAFKAKIFDHYGQAEISAMAHECEEHQGLHFLEDYAHVEFLDIDDSFEKKLIATNLHNSAMPLLRYDTGDRVVVHKEQCGCGRAFKMVRRISGRADQLLVHKTGYFIPSVNLYTFFSKISEVVRFQVIQNSQDELEVCVQLLKDADANSTEKIIKRELEEKFGSRIYVHVNTQFLLSGEGKCNPIVQRIRDI